MSDTPRFEWNEEKSKQTQKDRGLTFEDAIKLWEDPESIDIPAQLLGEPRWAKIGMLYGKIHTAILRFGEIVFALSV